MGNQHTVAGIVLVAEVAVQRPQQIVDAVIDIRAGLAARETVVEGAIGGSLRLQPFQLPVSAQIAPLLLPQARLLAVAELAPGKGAHDILKGRAGSPKRRDVEIDRFVTQQLLQRTPGLTGLLHALWREFDCVIRLCGEFAFVVVCMALAMPD